MKNTGMTSRLMKRMTSEPQSFEKLVYGFNFRERDTASKVLYQKTQAGHLIRTGIRFNYSYALPSQAKAGSNAPAAASGPVRDRMTPEQVCAAVLDLVRNTDWLTMQEISDRCDGCTAKDVKAAIAELLFGEVLRTETLHGATYYIHSGAELPGPDPLAAAFVPKSTRQRVDELQAELSALLLQQAGDHASPTVLHHIAAANHHLHQRTHSSTEPRDNPPAATGLHHESDHDQEEDPHQDRRRHHHVPDAGGRQRRDRCDGRRPAPPRRDRNRHERRAGRRAYALRGAGGGAGRRDPRVGQGVQIWAEANRHDLTRDGRTKTAKFAAGEIDWRTRPPRVVVRGEPLVLEALKRLGLERFVRTKEEIDKTAILAEPAAVDGIKGLSIAQGEDFVIKPFQTDLEEVQG